MSEDKKILIYSTPTCPYCMQVKSYLTSKGVAFTDFNVGSDHEAREAMKNKSGQMGVPVIDIDGTIIIGFNKTKLDALLV